MAKRSLASIIDHTLLKPEATESDIHRLCDEAIRYGFASVCVNPGWVKLCAVHLQESEVDVCTVIGFPLGATTTKSKVAETEEAIRNGAVEVDMVLNIGWLKSGFISRVQKDIAAVVKAANPDAIVKVILETGLLTDEEKKQACQISREAGAAFVKTSTGFSGTGATIEDVRLMRQTVGSNLGVKASGGIRDFEAASEMVEAGATRLGTSSGVAIVQAR